MDYYQGIVTEFLRADRAVFVNTECCIQLNPGANPDKTGPHWFCDAVAVNLREKKVFLCEVTYSKSLVALTKRLTHWASSWNPLRSALVRDCRVDSGWPVQPWIFIPKDLRSLLDLKLSKITKVSQETEQMPYPEISHLEDIAPWKYPSWNRYDEILHSETAPTEAKNDAAGDRSR